VRHQRVAHHYSTLGRVYMSPLEARVYISPMEISSALIVTSCINKTGNVELTAVIHSITHLTKKSRCLPRPYPHGIHQTICAESNQREAKYFSGSLPQNTIPMLFGLNVSKFGPWHCQYFTVEFLLDTSAEIPPKFFQYWCYFCCKDT
jgi:hypothetical protein